MSLPNDGGDRTPSLSESRIDVFRNSAGYQYYVSQTEGAIQCLSLHRLTAVAGGADPHDVWGAGNETHHRSGLKIDLPAGLEVLTPEEHRARHRDGLVAPSEILGADVDD